VDVLLGEDAANRGIVGHVEVGTGVGMRSVCARVEIEDVSGGAGSRHKATETISSALPSCQATVTGR
jgi:hypothetical protein